MTAEPAKLQGHWADHPSHALADLPEGLVVVLPLGATEQHGPHLPLSVDTDLTMAVIARMLGHLEADQSVLVLPPLAITKSDEHSTFPGTLALSAETLLALLRDIGQSLHRAKVKRLVLFNGHGGNGPVLEIAARDMRIRHQMIVCTTGWFGFADMTRDYDPADLATDIHAGDLETSAMLAARPERVGMALAQDFRSAQEAWQAHHAALGLGGQAARPAWVAQDLNPAGAVGNAAAASAEKGTRLIESAAQGFAEFLAAFAHFDPRNDMA